jgi:hypothetical protein
MMIKSALNVGTTSTCVWLPLPRYLYFIPVGVVGDDGVAGAEDPASHVTTTEAPQKLCSGTTRLLSPVPPTVFLREPGEARSVVTDAVTDVSSSTTAVDCDPRMSPHLIPSRLLAPHHQNRSHPWPLPVMQSGSRPPRLSPSFGVKMASVYHAAVTGYIIEVRINILTFATA